MKRSSPTTSEAIQRIGSDAHCPLLSASELAAFLGVPLPTIYRWRSRHEGPVGFKVGRHVRYSVDDVYDWLDSRRDPSTTD